MEHKSSYRQILKATSIFGGVQFILIIISLIKSKIIALTIGAAGLGTIGLLMSSSSFISSITNFSLGTTGIKEISNDIISNSNKPSKSVNLINNLSTITGLFGTIVMILFSSVISNYTFGNNNFTIIFITISISLFFNQLTIAKNTLIQSTRNISYLAKSNLISNAIALFFSSIIYLYIGINGIAPALVFSSIITYLFACFYANKIEIERTKMTFFDSLVEGKLLLFTGLIISFSSLLTTAVPFLVNAFINKSGGLEDVGLYTAGFAILNGYVGLIFTAMATDFYPRLSNTSNDNNKTIELINHQAEIAIIILTPILLFFILFNNSIIQFLYSTKFLLIEKMMIFATLGVFLKGSSWSIGFIFLAKGHTKSFFWNELISSIYSFILSIYAYKYYGLNGLGIAFSLTYLFHFIQIYIAARVKYLFHFNKQFIKLFIVNSLFLLLIYFVKFLLQTKEQLILGILVIISALAFAIFELDKKIELVYFFKNKINRFWEK